MKIVAVNGKTKEKSFVKWSEWKQHAVHVTGNPILECLEINFGILSISILLECLMFLLLFVVRCIRWILKEWIVSSGSHFCQHVSIFQCFSKVKIIDMQTLLKEILFVTIESQNFKMVSRFNVNLLYTMWQFDTFDQHQLHEARCVFVWIAWTWLVH